MTIDEAIKHAEEVAEEKDMQVGFDTDYPCYQMSDAERNQCKKCAEEHRQLAEWLKELKQLRKQIRWIPCGKRLPEVGSEVLVCYEFNGNRSVYIADFYGDGKFHGLDDEYLTPEGRKYRKAVAWMPLPTPYKASPTGAEGSEKK